MTTIETGVGGLRADFVMTGLTLGSIVGLVAFV
jgi:hypothetical protein